MPGDTPPMTPNSRGVPHYCLRCHARLPVHNPLEDVPAVAKCLRCGLPYVPGRPETYTTRRAPYYKSLWFNGLVLPVLVGLVCYAIVQARGSMGYVLFLGVPFVVGIVLGLLTRGTIWLNLMLALTAIACLVLALVSMSFSGVFCGFMLGVFFLGPAFLGVIIGMVIKAVAGDPVWDRRRYAILGAVVLLPLGAERIESRWPPAREVAEVRTSTVFPAPAGASWEAIQFYEEVTHKPPLLLKLALPRPVRTEGGPRVAVGHALRCLYRRGYLEKVITERDEPRRLVFVVTEQRIGFENEVALLDGRFDLEPIGATSTRVTVATRYRRQLRPAWLWEPMERTIIHTLHGHVLEGMRRRLPTEPSEPLPSPAP
jgi:hypothetical protein